MPWRKDYQIRLSFYRLKSFSFLITNFTLKLILAKRSFLTESLQHVQYRPFSAPCQYSLAFLEAPLSDHWARPQNSKLGLLILKCQQMRRFVTRSPTLKWTCKTWRAATSVIDCKKKGRWVPNLVERCVVGERVKPLLMRDNRAGLAPWKSFCVCRAQEVTHDPARKV